MTPDWFSGERVDRLVFEQIDPMDLEFSRGYLEGVDLTGGELSRGYYTDTRVSGSLKVVDSNYIEGSRIRIHHYVDEWNYHNELGTFFVGNDNFVYDHGIFSGSLDLWSALWALNEDYRSFHYAINTGSYTKAVLADIFGWLRPHRILDNVEDVRYSDTVIYELGDNILSQAYDVANKSNARLDVDGHGYVTVSPYIQPKNLTPSFNYEFNSSQSMITSDITMTTNRIDIPQRATVIFKDGDSEIYATADVDATSPYHLGRRGYRKVNVYTLNDLSPATFAQAEQEAAAKLTTDTAFTTEFSFKSLYLPIIPGDCVNLTFGGVVFKCLVKNITNTFKPGMEMTVQLKVV